MLVNWDHQSINHHHHHHHHHHPHHHHHNHHHHHHHHHHICMLENQHIAWNHQPENCGKTSVSALHIRATSWKTGSVRTVLGHVRRRVTWHSLCASSTYHKGLQRLYNYNSGFCHYHTRCICRCTTSIVLSLCLWYIYIYIYVYIYIPICCKHIKNMKLPNQALPCNDHLNNRLSQSIFILHRSALLRGGSRLEARSQMDWSGRARWVVDPSPF